MIKDPSNTATLTLTVKLRNGETFTGVDTTSRAFGETEKVVAFWLDGKVRIYPMELVEYIEMHTGEA